MRLQRDPLRPVMIGLITLYRYSLSYFLGRQCRHLPSCSEYAVEAIAQHGSWRGGWMALARISRCRPGGSAGLDPVPDTLPSYPLWQGWKYGTWSAKALARPTDAETDSVRTAASMDKRQSRQEGRQED